MPFIAKMGYGWGTIWHKKSEVELALKDTFKATSKDRKVTQLDMANTLGISKQNFSNKVKRNTFSPEELVKIADSLNMEIRFIDKDVQINNGNKYIICFDENEKNIYF